VELALADDPPLSPPAFAAIFEAELSYVHNTLCRLGVRSADIEDLTHDVFLAVHQGLPRFDARRPIRPWLFGIAFRVASDYRRRARFSREIAREADAADEAPAADEQLAADEARRLVLRALDGIELDRRAVLVLHDIDGHGVPEIAEALAIPLNTAYSRLRLARADFKAAVRRLRPAGGER
jgi:RNA polymerase sigma-70 factor (ECF subfamily)